MGSECDSNLGEIEKLWLFVILIWLEAKYFLIILKIQMFIVTKNALFLKSNYLPL